MNRILVPIAVAVSLALLVIANQMDYQAEKDLDAIYCTQVSKGYWPDYKHIYADSCKGVTYASR